MMLTWSSMNIMIMDVITMNDEIFLKFHTVIRNSPQTLWNYYTQTTPYDVWIFHSVYGLSLWKQVHRHYGTSAHQLWNWLVETSIGGMESIP